VAHPEETDDANRHVDQKDRWPAGNRNQQPAKSRPEGRRQKQHDACRRRHSAFSPAGEQHAHRQRHQRRSRSALQRAQDDQHLDIRRQRAQSGGDREAQQARQIHTPGAEAFREKSTRGQRCGQRQQIATDHPLSRGELGLELTRNVTDGDVHDVRIDH
jgi:hypothetical protein